MALVATPNPIPLKEPPGVAATLEHIAQLNQRAKGLRRTDPVTTVALSSEALALVDDIDDPSVNIDIPFIESHLNLGHGYFYQSNREDTLRHSLSALFRAEAYGDEALIAWAQELSGFAYIRIGNYAVASASFHQMNAIGKVLKDKRILAHSNRGLGVVSGEIGDPKRSIAFSVDSLVLFRQIGDLNGQAIALSNLCMASSNSGDYQVALEYGLEGLELCSTPETKPSIPYLLSNLGIIYGKLKQWALAHEMLDRAINMTTRGEDKYALSHSLIQQGHIWLGQNECEHAEKSLQRALLVAQEMGNPYCQYRAHNGLVEVYKLSADFERALSHHEQYHALYDEFANVENATRLRSLEASYDIAASEREARIFRDKADELEMRVTQRTSELEMLAQELKRAYQRESEMSELKSRIITTLSHEFRTPLTIINNSVDLITLHHDRVKPEKRVLLRKRMREAALYLTDLLQDIDLVSASDQGLIVSEFVNMPFNVACARVVQELSNEINDSERLNFHFDGADASLVFIDSDMLRQVIFNLLTNALKYSAETKPINITFQHTPHLTVTVQDYGIGIPEKEIDSVWDLFFRGSNVDVRRGLGLGLYIVQKLVEAMGAEISIISQLNKGSIFRLELPAHKAEDSSN